MALEIARHQFSIDDYHAMIEHGILHEDDRIELIEGEVVEMPPTGPPHNGCVNYLTNFFCGRLGQRAVVAPQNTVMIPPFSQLQPDIALLRPRDDFYRDENPYSADVLLLIEVSDSTLRFDRLVKLPLYAKAGIVESWIIDINGRAIEVYTDPTEIGYGRRRVIRGAETVAPGAFPDLTICADRVLGGVAGTD